jgi:predicted Zn-dependent peptidase
MVNFWALDVGCMMLREILFAEVRERQRWAYGVSADASRGEEFHEVSIQSSLRLSACKRIEEVVATCIAGLGRRADLLKRKKEYALGCCSLLDLTGRAVRDYALDDLSDHHRLITLKETIEGITAVTMDDVMKAFEHLRPERRCTQVTLP